MSCGKKNCSGCSDRNCSENRCTSSHVVGSDTPTHQHSGMQVFFCKSLSEDDKKCASKYGVSKGAKYDDIIWRFIEEFKALKDRIKEIEDFQEEMEGNNFNIPKPYVRQVGSALIVDQELDSNGKPILLKTGDMLFFTPTGNYSSASQATYYYNGLSWIQI